jgi:mannose-6-phosphate isomerase-like protein (cupin superfamily)
MAMSTLDLHSALFCSEGRIVSIVELIHGYWGRKVAHGKLDNFTFRAVSDSLNFHEIMSRESIYRLGKCFIRSSEAALNRRATSPKEAHNGLANGHTLQIRSLQDFLGGEHPTLQFARCLEETAGNRLDSITLFVSPPAARAIESHADETEILTIQLQGRKTWQITVDDASLLNIDRVILAQQDMLYVPAGVKHNVDSLDETSISLAFVYRPLRFKAVLDYLIALPRFKELLDCKISPPIDAIQTGRISDEIARFLLSFQAELVAVEPRSIADQIAQELRRSFAVSGGLSMLSGLTGEVTVTSSFDRLSDVQAEIIVEPPTLRLLLEGGTELRTPAFLEEEIRWVLGRQHPFSASEISRKLQPDDSVKLLRKLKRLGLIRQLM